MRAAVEGLLAGWAIAIPVGAIGVLILDRAAVFGFPTGAAAGLGTAAADFFYAGIAVVVGDAVATFAPNATVMAVVSALVLAAVALWMLRNALQPVATRPDVQPRSPARTLAAFFALTVINPATVVYFAALVAGLDSSILRTGADRVLFAGAALVASASWQLTLAGFGAVVGHRLPEGGARALRVAGGLGGAARSAEHTAGLQSRQ